MLSMSVGAAYTVMLPRREPPTPRISHIQYKRPILCEIDDFLLMGVVVWPGKCNNGALVQCWRRPWLAKYRWYVRSSIGGVPMENRPD